MDRENGIDDLSNYVREVSARLCLDLKWREVDAIVAEARSVAETHRYIDERLGKLSMMQAWKKSSGPLLEDGKRASRPEAIPIHTKG